MNLEFPEIDEIGFYPIVNNAELIEKMLSSGVKTVQIRVKNKDIVENEVKKSIEITKNYPNSQLFVNDNWELAIKYKAFGIHLGQEDIDSLTIEDFKKIANARIRLGISTHIKEEVQKALALNPSYLSIGPIFHTESKDLPYALHGIEGFKYWRSKINLPLVALAGIKLENCEELIKAGADGIAVMSAITDSEDSKEEARKWLNLWDNIKKL